MTSSTAAFLIAPTVTHVPAVIGIISGVALYLKILTLNRLQCPGERCLVGSRPQRALARIRKRAKNQLRNVGKPVGKRDRHWASPITQATLDCDIPDLLCRGLRYFL